MFAYEQLDVYKKAYLVNHKIYQLIKTSNDIPPYTKNQLGRASLSIMLNIAEGSAKFSCKDRRNFFIIARGSAFECSSLICFLYQAGEIDEEIKNALYNSFEEISRKLYTMIKNLEDRLRLSANKRKSE
jgi:four helix bundle protein